MRNREAERPTIRLSVDIATEDGPVTLITFSGLRDSREHVAVRYCPPAGAPADIVPLVRVHSACFTGDVFRSVQCDCRPQLDEAKRLCRSEGGYILYLDQEGRGIGLYAKLDAYLLQQQGLDTFAANEALGCARDARDFGVAADMLAALGLDHIRLLTNNPDKVDALRRTGQTVDPVSTGVFANNTNFAYLRAKRDITFHSLDLDFQVKESA